MEKYLKLASVGPVRRVMSLSDGKAKMSKSVGTEMSRINLSDDPDTIRAKVRLRSN